MGENLVIRMFKGALIGNILTLFMFSIFAMLLTYTSVNDSNIDSVVYTVIIASAFLSGFYTARKAHGKGWFTGGLTALIYALIIMSLIYLSSKGIAFDKNTLKFLLVCLLSGSIGGIIGINFNRK